MISCLPGTVLDQPDQRVIEQMSGDWLNFRLDSNFLNALPEFHGGVPSHPYFLSASGHSHCIAFFLNFVDEHSELRGPLRKSKNYFHDSMDERVTDRGVNYIVDCDPNGFFNGDRLIPFAALFTPYGPTREYANPDDSSVHLTLTPLSSVTCNALCFDKSTNPHSIVIFDAERSSEEQSRFWDDDADLDTIRYDEFIDFVAESFAEFTRLLTDSPLNT